MLYKFSMQNSDGSHRQKNSSMTLENDPEARGFGERVISEMTERNLLQYAGCTLHVATAEREVCSLKFPAAA